MNTQVLSMNSPTIDWDVCNREAKLIYKFFSSLNKERIGAGKMSFDEANFCLVPRSSYFNNTLVQQISSFGDKGANFGANLTALQLLFQKIENLKAVITQFKPESKEECSQPQSLLISLINIQAIVEVAKEGLEKLCNNYHEKKESEKENNLQQKGKLVFDTFNPLPEELTQKLRPFCHDLNDLITLEKYHDSGNHILQRREANHKHLLSTHFDPAQGTVIAKELINDCLQDAKEKPPIKEALRFAAIHIKLPKRIDEIPTQDGKTRWTPKRPIKNGNSVTLDNGIWGSCEKIGSGDNLCNLFYQLDSETDYLIISSEAINTWQKAEQLIAVIKESNKKMKNCNGRWHFHALYSSEKEEKRLLETNQLLPSVKKALMSELNKKEIEVSQINTCFTPSLYSNATRQINLETILLCIHYSIEELCDLLRKSKLKGDSYKDKTFYDYIFEKGEIIEKEVDEQNKLDHEKILYLSQEVKKLKDLSEKKINLKELNKIHKLKKTDLEKEIKEIAFQPLIDTLQHIVQSYTQDSYLKKGLLIFKLLKNIVDLQLNQNSSSRITEIELLLLFYRLLAIKPIIFCSSGLDLSACCRALADTQIMIEKELFEKNDVKVSDNELRRIYIQEKIYYMILTLDKIHNEIFLLVNNNKNSFNLNIDLSIENTKKVTKEASEKTTRELFFELLESEVRSIEAKKKSHDLSKLTTEIQHSSEQLKEACYYFEIYAYQLLHTELIKTLYSTGCAGFNWLEEGSLLYGPSVNLYPLKRFPPFIFSEEGDAIALVQLIEGGYLSSETLTLTPAGNSLLIRLSKLRER